MNSIDDKPAGEETTLYRAQCHWAILLGPTLVLFIGILSLQSRGYHALALIAFGLFWGIFSYINLQRSEITMTQNKLRINAGFPIKKSYNIPLNKIAFIDFYQPSLGSMLNFGKIMIVSEEKKKCVVRFVSAPADLVREVQRQVMALRQSPAKTE